MHLFRLFIIAFLAVILGSGYSHAGFTENGLNANGTNPVWVSPGNLNAHDMSPRRPEAKAKHKDDEILVKFRAGVSEERKKKLHNKHGAGKLKEFGSLRLHLVKLQKGMSVEEAVKLYQADPDVEYAEPDFLYEVMVSPDDPQYSQLWGMAKINAPAAWDSATGAGTVVVAIIDTGIDYTHPDLAANIWTNPGEIAGNGIDDDGNGYVDDVNGINAILGSGNPMDDHGHGTHVAGTIGAVGNNGVGVVGVNWNVKMIACKYAGSSGSGYASDEVECLQYIKSLKERGINIVATNNSWGGGAYSQSLYDAINAQRDILFVGAAGNNSANSDLIPFYPAGYALPNVIAVAATDASDLKAGFSNYGRRSVHLAAPGWSIASTYPTTSAFSSYGGYRTLSGTSMAAPHVTGLAALLKAQDFDRSWFTLRNLLLAGGDSVTTLADLTMTGRRINAHNSLNCTDSPVSLILKFPKAPVVGQPQTLSALSINCAAPAGPVGVNLSGGGTVALRDDGIAPDELAGDGIFTGTWTPTGTAVQVLTYNFPTASDSVASPSLKFADATVTTPPAALSAGKGVYGPLQVYLSMRLATSGGLPDFIWTILDGLLPPGLSLDQQTGEISGTPSTAGVFNFIAEVKDSLGTRDVATWTITISDGLRPGWPKELARRTSTGGYPAFSPVFADLDGDGKDEIIAADNNTLYLIDENGVYNSKTFTGNPSTPVVVDLDNDGQKEIVITVSYNTTTPIHAFHADLTPVAGFPAGAYNGYNVIIGSPAAAALAGDGSTQIIAVGHPIFSGYPDYRKEIIQVIGSTGSALPGWPKVVNFDSSTPYDKTVAVGDVDNDGVNEIVFVSVDGTVRIYRKDGTEAARWPVAGIATNIRGPVLADMNGDGILEIITGYNTGSGTYAINVHDKDGVSLAGWPATINGQIKTQPVPADLDGDGKLEIIVGMSEYFSGSGSVSSLKAFRGDGSEAPGWPAALPAGAFTLDASPIIGDMDGDGRNEVLITVTFTSNGCNGACGTSNRELRAYTFDGQTVPGFPKYLPPDVHVRSTPIIGDLDNDNRADIALNGDDGMLYVWEAASPSAGKTAGWPMYLHDLQHSRALPPAMVLPVAHDFGQLIINTTATKTFTITNKDPSPIIVTAAGIGGLDSSFFTLTPGTCAAFPVSLSPATSCTVEVTFAPGSSSGAKAATLEVQSNALRGTVSVPLAGTGILGKHTFTLTKNGAGYGIVVLSPGTVCADSCSFEYASGTQVTLTATPNAISLFSGWNGACSGTGTCVLTMDGDRQVGATFALSGTVAPGVAISAGSLHTVVLKSDGTVWSWGINSSGQVGDGTTTLRSSPVKVFGLSGIARVSAGDSHTLAVKADGTVVAWGGNGYGQLGDGTIINRYMPVQVPGIAGVVAVAAGTSHSVALKNDGTVWTWGFNSYGQLGDGTTTARRTPVQVSDLTGVTAIAAGEDFTLALKGDGTIWAWGTNSSGQLGDGTKTDRPLPTMVPGLTGMAAIEAGRDHSVALKAEGTVWSWGYNGFGQLGDGTSTERLTPWQLPGTFTSIAAGGYHTLAVKGDSTLWTWGRNYDGQLGDGTQTQRLAPVKAQASAYAAAGGMSHTVALQGDGAIVTWGDNAYGQLGDGTTTDRAVPVQVPAFNAVFPAATISGTPPSPTTGIGATLTVGGTGVVAYKFKLDTGAYAAETPVATAITITGLSDGPHTVSVLGRDSDGFWQAVPTTATWTIATWPVTTPGVGGGYWTISEAYNALPADGILRIRGVSLPENLDFNRNINITLRGGYDPATDTSTGFTTIKGSMVISAGTVEVENLILTP